MQFGLGGRDDASDQCDFERAMWQHVAKHLLASTLLCLAGQEPPADAQKRAHWCMHLSAMRVVPPAANGFGSRMQGGEWLWKMAEERGLYRSCDV